MRTTLITCFACCKWNLKAAWALLQFRTPLYFYLSYFLFRSEWYRPPVSRNIGPISRDIDPGSFDIGPVSRNIGPVSRDMGPVSRDIGPVSRDIDPVSRNIGPASGNGSSIT